MDYCLDTISEEEKEILQEIMNIAFGKAAADLAELIKAGRVTKPVVAYTGGKAAKSGLRALSARAVHSASHCW
jgi:succinyl-CoA synthetase alpha subunit